MKSSNNFDVAVIGGGPAGIMAAIKASEAGKRIVLVEKKESLGKKFLLSGGGRCNFTNANFDAKSLAQHYGKEGYFLLHGLSVFGSKQVIEFFNSNGLKTKVEKDNKVYCATDAKDALAVLIKLLENNNITVLTDASVKEIKKIKNKISKIILKDKSEIKAENYILATGGKSYPTTGSTGEGYGFAEALGHKIEKLRPSLSPIKTKEEWIINLQGLSLKDEKLNILLNGKKVFSETGDIIFTHFGLSGPAILNASQKIGELLEKGEVKISLDLFADLNIEETEKELQNLLSQNSKQNISNLLSQLFSQKLSNTILSLLEIAADKKCGAISKKEWQMLAKQMKNLEMTIMELMGYEHAMVTSGGISLKEIDAKTMRSKLINNLYFAGEIINLHGPTGGYNLQECWSTGYLAGENAAR